jgi:CRP-like cAMP-binding protein
MSMALDYSRMTLPHRSKPALTVVVTGHVEDDDARALQQLGMTLNFARNETIFSEGDEAKYSYKVVSGAIRLCKYLADGRRQIAEFVLPGEFCGLLHLNQHRFTAEASSDTIVVAYPQRQIEALGEKMPCMQRRLTAFLAQRLKAIQDHLVLLGRQTARERVASFLFMLAERAGASQGRSVPLPMSRQDIADYLGLTIETVCRMLSDLKRARVVRLPHLHEFIVDDVARLRALAETEE